jgi:hypothetical protein
MKPGTQLKETEGTRMSTDQHERILVLTDDPGAEKSLRPRLEELAGTRDLELKIVAPIKPQSGLDLFTGEVDDAIAGAGARAGDSAVDAAAADEVATTHTEVGDADQLLAIEDALATFEADRIVLVEPDEDLLTEARGRIDLPITELGAA